MADSELAIVKSSGAKIIIHASAKIRHIDKYWIQAAKWSWHSLGTDKAEASVGTVITAGIGCWLAYLVLGHDAALENVKLVLSTIAAGVIGYGLMFVHKLFHAPFALDTARQGHIAILEEQNVYARNQHQSEIDTLNCHVRELQQRIQRLPAPEIFVHYERSEAAQRFPGILPQHKQLIIENTAGIDAYEVQVKDLSIEPSHCKATFLPISRLAAHSKYALTTKMIGKYVPDSRETDFTLVFCGCGREEPWPVDENGRVWFTLPIVIVFRDYEEQWYKATFKFRSDDWFTFPEIRLESRERIVPPEV